MIEVAENPRAVIGHNMSPFDMVEVEIGDLYSEARNWLDGNPIQSQAEAETIATLMDLLRKAEKRADDLRKEEVRPLDEAKQAIQDRYHPLIGKTKAGKGKAVAALDACKATQTAWLIKLDNEKRAAAELARREAEEKTARAQAAIRAADAANIAEREEAERLVREAAEAEHAATKAEKDKAQAKGDGARAIGLRTSYRAEVTNHHAYLVALWKERHPDLIEFLEVQAQRQVDSGRRHMDGVTVHEDRRAV